MAIRRTLIPVEGAIDSDGCLVSSGQDELGREIPDPVPVAAPFGSRASMTLADLIRRMVHSEHLRLAAEQEQFDTFEEAEDFDTEDDHPDPLTPYEEVFEMKEKPNVASPNPSAAVDPGAAGAVHRPGAAGLDPTGSEQVKPQAATAQVRPSETPVGPGGVGGSAPRG